MFEVGKKYKGNVSGMVRECVAVHGDQAWLIPAAIEGDKGSLRDRREFNNHTEYKEPRSAKPIWINVYEHEGQLIISGTPHLSEESAKDAVRCWGRAYKVIDTIEVTYTEKTNV